ncbi:hypothetical protein D3C87_1843630 [compost metagenome]
MPTSVARWVSWSAPERISEAEADPPSTSTTTGLFLGMARRPVESSVSRLPSRSTIWTTGTPLSMNMDPMLTALGNRPPGLPRRSSTRALLFLNLSRAWRIS